MGTLRLRWPSPEPILAAMLEDGTLLTADASRLALWVSRVMKSLSRCERILSLLLQGTSALGLVHSGPGEAPSAASCGSG